MEHSKKQATSAQVATLMEFMQTNSDLAKGVSSGLDRDEFEEQWNELAETLNSMCGAIKSVDKWKQTWRDLKCNKRKRLRLQHTSNDSTNIADTSLSDKDYVPPNKRCTASFDEEIIRIEKEKLDIDREYKSQKIEVLSRIASALELIASKNLK